MAEGKRVIDAATIKKIMPFARSRADQFWEPLSAAMHEFEIIGPGREAAFLAQIAHESAELRYAKEMADGSAYEGRKDLGNTEPGDGPRFKGRGLIQITGRANYVRTSTALGIDCVAHPEILEETENAFRVSAWFWREHGCNQKADNGDFEGITHTINGGLNGYAQRLEYYKRAQQVLAGT